MIEKNLIRSWIPKEVSSLKESDLTLLTRASKAGCSETVSLLLDKRWNINRKGKDGFSALDHAIHKNQKAIVSLLVQKGAHLTMDHYLLACSKERHEIAKTISTKLIENEFQEILKFKS